MNRGCTDPPKCTSIGDTVPDRINLDPALSVTVLFRKISERKNYEDRGEALKASMFQTKYVEGVWAAAASLEGGPASATDALCAVELNTIEASTPSRPKAVCSRWNTPSRPSRCDLGSSS